MDDGDILAVDLRRLELLEQRDGLVDLVRRQLCRGVKTRAARDRRVRAVRADLVAVLHVRTGHDHVAHQLVLRRTSRRAQLLRRTQNDVVDRVQLQLVRHRHIRAVLRDGLRHRALAKLLPRRDHALGQRARILERIPLAPLHGLAAPGRQYLLAGKLRVDELRPRVFQQLGVVKRLHRSRHAAALRESGRLARIGVHVIAARVHQRTGVGKQLQIHLLMHIHSPFPPHRRIVSPRLALVLSSSLVCRDQCSGLSANAPPAPGVRPLSRGRRYPACMAAVSSSRARLAP